MANTLPVLLTGAPLGTSAGSNPEVPPTTWAFVTMPPHSESGDDATGVALACVAGTSLAVSAYEDTSTAQDGSSLQLLGSGTITTGTELEIGGAPKGGRKVWIKITAVNGSVTTLLGEPRKVSPGTTTTTVSGTVTANQGTMTPAVAAPADAEANATTMSRIGSYIFGFNGSTWDRLRTAATTIASTFTGILNTLPWGIYHSARTTRTTGQGGPLETMSDGSLCTSEQFVPGYSFANYSTSQTATTIKSGNGVLRAVIINKPVASAVITIWDNTAGSGTKIATITLPATLNSDTYVLIYDVAFANGLTVTTTNAPDVTFVYA